MGFAATLLDDLSFPEILHLVSFNKKSGRLTLTCREGHALLAFTRGRLVFAASNKLKESFGYILLRNGALAEADLLHALERQNRLEHDRRLGSLLVETGMVSADAARQALRQQAQWVITEVFQWRSGFFKFESAEEALPGVRPSHGGVLPPDGFDTEEILLDAVTILDRAYELHEPEDKPAARTGEGQSFRVPPEWERATGFRDSWSSLLREMHSPAFSGEIALTLMRYAAQIVSRGVLLLVGTTELLSIGHFGVHEGTAPRHIRIPLTEPSIFLGVVQTQSSFEGRLSHLFWNDHFLEQIGGAAPPESVIVPLILDHRAAYVFYGDNLTTGAPIGSIGGLEFLMAEAALAMERLLRNEAPLPATNLRRRLGDHA